MLCASAYGNLKTTAHEKVDVLNSYIIICQLHQRYSIGLTNFEKLVFEAPERASRKNWWPLGTLSIGFLFLSPFDSPCESHR